MKKASSGNLPWLRFSIVLFCSSLNVWITHSLEVEYQVQTVLFVVDWWWEDSSFPFLAQKSAEYVLRIFWETSISLFAVLNTLLTSIHWGNTGNLIIWFKYYLQFMEFDEFLINLQQSVMYQRFTVVIGLIFYVFCKFFNICLSDRKIGVTKSYRTNKR